MEQNNKILNYDVEELKAHNIATIINDIIVEFQDNFSMILRYYFGNKGNISFGTKSQINNMWGANFFIRIRINKSIKEIINNNSISKNNIEIINSCNRSDYDIYNCLEIMLADFSNAIYTSKNTGGERS